MTRAPGLLALSLLLAAGFAPGVAVHAQALAEPVIRGRVLLGDSVLRSGTVILHRVSESTQGEVDSARVGTDGSFALRLPAVPDPRRSDVYFASVRYAGILYFGKALTLPVQLDSLYEIQTYDTLTAPEGGADLAVQGRTLFVEERDDRQWQVTDLFEIRNDRGATLVAREGEPVWLHPLPEGARDPEVRHGELVSGGAEVREGTLVVTAPLPPGQRLLVVRYTVPDPFLAIPLPKRTESLEVYVREPSPRLQSPHLQRGEPAELEPGAIFQRLTGSGLEGTVVRLAAGGGGVSPPPASWMAVMLAVVLTAVGLWAARSHPGARSLPPSPLSPRDRRALVLEIARLDEEFSARRARATPEELGAYEARRQALLRRLSSLG